MSEPNPIDAILARLKASTAPAVNPSVAAQVLDTATRAEVANAPAPAPAVPAVLEKMKEDPAVLANFQAELAAKGLATTPAPTPVQTTIAVGGPGGGAGTAEPKTRRTAAVVQQELDAALIRIAELEARAPLEGDCLDTTEKLVSALRARGYKVLLESE